MRQAIIWTNAPRIYAAQGGDELDGISATASYAWSSNYIPVAPFTNMV